MNTIFTAFSHFRSSHWRCSVKIDIPKNFTKFPEKNLCQSFFLNKIAGLTCNFLKRNCSTGIFLWIFANFLRAPFFTEHLPMMPLMLINKHFVFIIIYFSINSRFFCMLKGELHPILWNLTFINKLKLPLVLRSFFKASENW